MSSRSEAERARTVQVQPPGLLARLSPFGPRALLPFGTPRVEMARTPALEVRLAETARDVKRAQRLRYKVFFEEGSAVPAGVARLSRRDVDVFDSVCDHLLVLDHDVAPKPFRATKPKVVGTYRLLRREVAQATLGFYSAREFDLAPLLRAQPDCDILELGRSCVLRPYRSKRIVDLLWQGLWAYVLRHRMDAMIGCASLAGTDPVRLAQPLSYLHHHAASPPEWRVRARPECRAEMNLLTPGTVDARAAFKALPPLLKGYLRVGATVGDGAAIDRAFGTTDVFVVMPVAAIRERYIDHFGPAANRVPA